MPNIDVQIAEMIFHSLLTLDKQDLIYELFCKTNSGGRGRNPPFGGICGKAYSFIVFHRILNLKGVLVA